MQSITNKQEATGPVKAVVLDWAGTAVDYGCMGPAAVFVDVFQRFGIRVTVAEARKFMGLEKKAYVRSLCGLTAVGGQWREKYGREPTEADLEALYRETEPMMVAAIAQRCGVACEALDSGELDPPDLERLDSALGADSRITHVGMVHCESTTGMLNPVEAAGRIVRAHRRSFIVDAMSSFGGIPMEMEAMGADYLISSANKCIQGVPGFGFVIARRAVLEQTRGQARSLSLDLYDQWHTMEQHNGKWRFTYLTTALDPQRFWQINRGTIVHIASINKVSRSLTGRGVIRLKSRPETLTISRSYLHRFKQM